MIRIVQLELTLEVEVEAEFNDGAWEVDDIAAVRIEGHPIDIGENRLGDLLLNDTMICQRLADLYAQQEP